MPVVSAKTSHRRPRILCKGMRGGPVAPAAGGGVGGEVCGLLSPAMTTPFRVPFGPFIPEPGERPVWDGPRVGRALPATARPVASISERDRRAVPALHKGRVLSRRVAWAGNNPPVFSLSAPAAPQGPHRGPLLHEWSAVRTLPHFRTVTGISGRGRRAVPALRKGRVLSCAACYDAPYPPVT